MKWESSSCGKNFYPRSPRGERPLCTLHRHRALGISIHAPREGSDKRRLKQQRMVAEFLSTLPARGATAAFPASMAMWTYFYPRSPRGERHYMSRCDREFFEISIHAPREGSDGAAFFGRSANRISIHAPREGSDMNGDAFAVLPYDISIHAPREGSDVRKRAGCLPATDFYPRSPRGERRCFLGPPLHLVDISIHAPREGSDREAQRPAGRPDGISIHAPREGSDARLLPRLCGASGFLSTLPARGATVGGRKTGRTLTISIHAPREGSDLAVALVYVDVWQFLSTLPARGATCPVSDGLGDPGNFYPRSPRGERHLRGGQCLVPGDISIHAPREGSDRSCSISIEMYSIDFYPRSPRGERLWCGALFPA